MKNELLSDDQRAAQLKAAQEIFATGVEAGAEAGAEVAQATVDVNGDGKTNAADQAAVDAARRNMDAFAKLSPEQQATAKNDPVFIKSKAVIDRIRKNATTAASTIQA